MKRLIAAAAILPLLAMPASAEAPVPVRAAAKNVLDASLAPLLSPTLKDAPARIVRCHRADRRTHDCRAVVNGTSDCRLIIRVRDRRDGSQLVYAKRMRCSS